MVRCGTVGTGVFAVVAGSFAGGGVVIAGRGVTIDFDAGVDGGNSFTVGSVDRREVGRGDGVVAGAGTVCRGA